MADKIITIKINQDFKKSVISETITELCDKGIGNGNFQDYKALSELLSVLCQIEDKYSK